MNGNNLPKSRVARRVVGLFLLGIAGALCWLSERPARASWYTTPMPGEGTICVDSGDSPPVPLPLPAESLTAFSPLAGMSLDQIKAAAQTLTPEAASLLGSVDVQFHNLYLGTTLDGPTAVTSVTIQTSLCIEDMWVQIILPAQSSGGAKFAYALKSPSFTVDRLHDWIRFPFPALNGTVTAGVGLDGFVEGAYPFTWVIGYGDTILITEEGFFAVGACCCEGPSCAPGETPPVSSFSSLKSLPLESPVAFNPLDGKPLDQVKAAAQTLAPEAASLLSSLDVQFHNLNPGTTLDGPTAVTSVTIQSSICLEDVWAQIILPAQSSGGAKFAYALKSPSFVVDRLHDWIRFPFPAINGTASASVGLDGFAEGVYPFTWVIGQGDTVLMTREGIFTVGTCCCGGTSSPLDVQFHNLNPGTTLDGPTAVTSVTIQSSMCLEDVWAQIILPAQSSGGAKFAYALKSPSFVVDRLHDWIRFPFPAINGTASASVGLDGFAEGVYPFTWVIGQGDTVLMTREGFFAVGACCCGIRVVPPTPTPAPLPSSECIQYSPEQIDVPMSAGQAVWREVEFVNKCHNTFTADFRLSDLSSQIYLADGHDQIALAPNERQAVRLYFTTGATVPSYSTELVATADGVGLARIPISMGPGAAIQPSASLSALNDVSLLPGTTGVVPGTIQNNSGIPLTVTGTVSATSSPWLIVTDANPATDVSVLWRQPKWELEPGAQAKIYFILHSSETLTATGSFRLESQYGDRQEIPVAARFGPYADLVVSAPPPPREMASGDITTALITVTNLGPSAASVVRVPVVITGDAAVIEVTAGSGVTCRQGEVVVCDAAGLPAGESITAAVRLEATATEPSSSSERLPMAALLQVETLVNTHDPNSLNNVWFAIWGGARVHLPTVVRN
jgi:hypothetical protein